MRYGIAGEDLDSIIKTIRRQNKVKKLILFGSRAKNNFRKGSDIDIAIIADELSLSELNQIRVDLSELLLPYKVDVIDYSTILNKDIIEHINKVGVTIE
ncbi:MAG: nucleotidyltransferase domain-containing protein [Ignavibacteria bacterium]|nr:nucleotidyltransferase domain-containing protein [Ignavibacteria bacterium]